jgi:hypothetical protein
MLEDAGALTRVRYDCLEIVYDNEALPDEGKLIMYDGVYPVRWSRDSGDPRLASAYYDPEEDIERALEDDMLTIVENDYLFKHVGNASIKLTAESGGDVSQISYVNHCQMEPRRQKIFRYLVLFRKIQI